MTLGATIHVDVANCPGPGDGSVGNPFCSIQDGIDAAVSGADAVVVEVGTYHENIFFNGKAIALVSTDPTNPAVVAATIIDGGSVSSVVTCSSGETASTVLNGLTITNGFAGSGGGMANSSAHPTVMNCVFVGNSATFGGAMHNNQSDPLVMNCQFIGNDGSDGGAMDNFSSSNPTVLNCIFAGNVCAGDGGGINNCGSHPLVVNCTFSGNMAGDDAGGMMNTSSSPTLTNCTFSGTTAFDDGGAMLIFNSNPASTNCIYWGNSDSGGMNESGQIRTQSGTPTVDFSDVQGGWTGSGTNNVNVDPLFVDGDGADNVAGTADDDLKLLPGSLCIDAGDNGKVTTSTNLDGNSRIQGCVVDMGAYEYAQAEPVTDSDTDCDGDVDGVDFAQFAQCFNKAGNPPRTLGCSGWAAGQHDSDDDGDVDGVDFARFAQCFNKAGNPPRTLGCPEN